MYNVSGLCILSASCFFIRCLQNLHLISIVGLFLSIHAADNVNYRRREYTLALHCTIRWEAPWPPNVAHFSRGLNRPWMRCSFLPTLPFSFPSFAIQQITTLRMILTITACATRPTAICPSCQHISRRVHSYYTRSPLADTRRREIHDAGNPIAHFHQE